MSSPDLIITQLGSKHYKDESSKLSFWSGSFFMKSDDKDLNRHTETLRTWIMDDSRVQYEEYKEISESNWKVVNINGVTIGIYKSYPGLYKSHQYVNLYDYRNPDGGSVNSALRIELTPTSFITTGRIPKDIRLKGHWKNAMSSGVR